MGEEENPEEKENKEKMLRLTGLADQILTRSGNMEIYEETFESISFKIKQADEKRFGAKTSIPEDVDDDDALDMFADSLDDKTVGKGLPEASANGSKNGSSTVIKNGNAEAISGKKEIVLDEIMWEFKWENTEESEIHGPHTSDKMHQWQESGFFDKGVFARKVGGGGEFNTSKRIDFELYT
jgi:CD2 antigen cytoplasmic tail-binding protein 2